MYSDRMRKAEVLQKFTKSHRGSSFPTEALLESGSTCIVKLYGAGNGIESVLSEFVVNRTAHLCGFPVPDAFPVLIPEGFAWKFGTDEFDDLVQKSFGMNLGIQLIPGAEPVPRDRYPELPKKLQEQVQALDLFFANYDRSLQSQNILLCPQTGFWMVDHGSCRFLNTPASNVLAQTHFLAKSQPRSRDLSYLKTLMEFDFAKVVAEIPPEWMGHLGLNSEQVLKSLSDRRDRIQLGL